MRFVPSSNRRQKSPAVVGSADAFRTKCVEKHPVLTPQLDVVERLAATQRVVGDVQHVVGFMVGPMLLKQVDLLVDAPGPAQPH